jgi:Protein of unknown function (DUF4038)/Domain of unknown function (DUF5060)
VTAANPGHPRCGERATVAACLTVAGIAALLSCSKREVALNVSFSQSATSVEAYDMVEVSMAVAPPRSRQPFTEVVVHGSFERVDGDGPRRVDGFCDSTDGSMFRIRFMPPAPGDYRYSVDYRQDGAERNSQGVFHVTKGRRKGPVRIDPDYPAHFIWEGTGEHYFFNGTTAYWLLGWRDEGVIRTAIERLHRLRVNRIRVTIAGRSDLAYGAPVITGPNWTTYVEPWPAQNPHDIYHPGFDFGRFNVDYWQKFDRALRFARERDMIISLVLDMNDSRVHPAAGSGDERRFIRYAVARFGAFPNITWDLGDDVTGYRDDAWARSTGTLVKEWDPYRHLTTSHPLAGDNDHQDRAASWFDFTSFQDWSRSQHAFMLEQRAAQLRVGRMIPQTNEEYGYEDHYPVWAPKPDGDSADSLRRTAWGIVMAGGYQTTGESARRGSGVWPDTGGGWLNGRGDETMTMLNGYALIVAFFERFAWWTTDPHDELVNRGNYCLAKPGELYAAYLPNGGRATIRIGPGRYAGTWYSAKTGRTATLGVVKGPVWKSPAPPGDGDWALLLARSGAESRPEGRR